MPHFKGFAFLFTLDPGNYDFVRYLIDQAVERSATTCDACAAEATP